jgi:hypothetical protein
MRLDELFILRHPSSPTNTRPIRAGLIVERDINVCVVLDLFEFRRDVVADEQKV